MTSPTVYLGCASLSVAVAALALLRIGPYLQPSDAPLFAGLGVGALVSWASAR
ncbi:hypothetical protein [Halogranum gelatinilyticum]|uniref:hypothetical protein n=1 Tax=Halogranum gelatinilyticum TaxID=660521 RepID=UPI001481A1DF|nr:hypothetical protein [Halogranum gelatinilyticum]